MNAAVFQAVPAAASPLTEKDPGFTTTGTAPVAATPVLATAVFAMRLRGGCGGLRRDRRHVARRAVIAAPTRTGTRTRRAR